MTTPSAMRDTVWATHTCPLAFQSVGVWPENADGTDVNTVSRSNDQSLMASGDDWGKVKLFTYPAVQPKVCCSIGVEFKAVVNNNQFVQSLSHPYGGHSSHVTSVAFMHDDARLVSTGGNDTSVMQWIVS